MTNANPVLTYLNRPWVRYALGACLVFALGFFLFHGRLASISGSWKYVMRTTDDNFYWASAKGAAEHPTCEGNPYYYEGIGKRHGIPYPVVTLTGWLAKILHVPILFFFPIWHIGMPFLLWLSLYFCLTRFWRYPQGASAALSLIFLLVTLYLRDISHHTIFRYSRPGDALWLLFIWISVVMNSGGNQRRRVLGLSAISFLVFWINPFLAMLGIWVTVLELIWQLAAEKNKKSAKGIMVVILSCVAAAASYGLYIKLNMAQNAEVMKQLAISPRLNAPKPEFASLMLYGIVLAMVFASKFGLKTPFSKIDRALLFVLSMEPLLGNLGVLIPQKMMMGYHRYNLSAELSYHRYSYAVIEIACLTAWLIQKIPVLLKHPKFKRVEYYAAAVVGVILAWILMNGDLSFFRYAPNVATPFSMDNPVMLLTVLPALVLTVWTIFRFEPLRKIVTQPYSVLGFILLMTVVGYPLLASQSYDPKTHHYRFVRFPFDGAYQWLKQNAQKNDVVLTAPPSRLDMDYLVLYTDLKTYIHPFGARLEDKYADNDNTFKFLFYFNLLVDDFKGFAYKGIQNVEDKFRRDKLDYVLIDLETPFLPHIAAQLRDYADPVYKDDRCLLLKIKPGIAPAR